MVPETIHDFMKQGAALVVSISGGKDGQAMAEEINPIYISYGWTGQIYAIHADLGRAEWPQSMPMCQQIAAKHGWPLEIVQRGKGDLVQQIEDRKQALAGTGKPFWPSAKNRYCTSDQKRDPINKILRKHELVISCDGLRAEESATRAKKPALAIRKRITAKRLRDLPLAEALNARRPGERLALDWRPILDWKVAQVYEACGHSLTELTRRRELYAAGHETEALAGWTMHPAYVFGNDRVSCMLCILATANDLRNGATHNPELAEHYFELEVIGGSTFKSGKSLAEICDGC